MKKLSFEWLKGLRRKKKEDKLSCPKCEEGTLRLSEVLETTALKTKYRDRFFRFKTEIVLYLCSSGKHKFIGVRPLGGGCLHEFHPKARGAVVKQGVAMADTQ